MLYPHKLSDSWTMLVHLLQPHTCTTYLTINCVHNSTNATAGSTGFFQKDEYVYIASYCHSGKHIFSDLKQLICWV